MRPLIRAGLALAVLTVACRTGSSIEEPRIHATILQAPADKALVVFVRDTHGHEGTSNFDIMDETGRVYGASATSSHFFIDVEPGHHVFFKADSCNVSVLDVTLAAHKIYFVHIEVSNNEEAELYAVKPGTSAWEKITDQYNDTHEELARPSLTSAPSLVAYALATWRGYLPDTKDQHRLLPGDGFSRVRLDD